MIVQSSGQKRAMRVAAISMLLVMSVATNVLWGFEQQVPVAGKGSGGAVGPSIVIYTDLPTASTAKAPTLVPPQPEMNLQVTRRISPAPLQTQSQDVGDNRRNTSQDHLQVESAFRTFPELDVAGATNGSYILASDGNGTFTIYDLAGNIVKTIQKSDFWCGGTLALPICSAGGFDGDQRVVYDVTARRWIITALWVHGSNSIATNLIAVSQTKDPRLGWNLYQFPACGLFDTWDKGDQPHTGFSNRWIVVNSLCTEQNGTTGIGLVVFNKRNLYIGKSLTLNENWFEFADPFDGRSDNPVNTYNSTNRQYLTHADIDPSGFATITYSYLTGFVRRPVLFSSVETVTTGFEAAPAEGTLVPAVSAPGCSGCMQAWSNSWIHSSGLFSSHGRGPWIISSVVMGDPRHVNATQVISVATNISTHRSVASRLTKNQDGTGPMASEIAMPLKRSVSEDEALVVYDDSESTFYPGLKAVLWNLENNTLSDEVILQQGSLTPIGFNRGRWVDFIDAISPIPGTSRLVVAGSLAASSAIDPEHATYWAQVSP